MEGEAGDGAAFATLEAEFAEDALIRTIVGGSIRHDPKPEPVLSALDMALL